MHVFDRFFKIMTKPIIMFFYIIIIILSIFYFDKLIAVFIHSNNLSKITPFLMSFTMLGKGLFYIALIPVLIFICRYIIKDKKWERRFSFLWLCVAFPYMVCAVLKVLFGRARPDLLFSHDIYGFLGPDMQRSYHSFPSGHATSIMGLMFGLGIIFPKHFYRLFIFGLLIVLSRILLLQHYISDVLAAGYLTMLEVGFILYWCRNKFFFESNGAA